MSDTAYSPSSTLQESPTFADTDRKQSVLEKQVSPHDDPLTSVTSPSPAFINDVFIRPYCLPEAEICESIIPLVEELLEKNVEAEMHLKLIEIFNMITQTLGVACGDEACRKPLVFTTSPPDGPSLPSHRGYGLVIPNIVALPPKEDSARFLPHTSHGLGFGPSAKYVINRFPWAMSLAVIEAKLDKKWGDRAVRQYMNTALTYRPDAINMLGMSCNKTGFRFHIIDTYWEDTSDIFSWYNDLDKLIHFVYTLHWRYAEDVERESGMQLHKIDWDGTGRYATTSWRCGFKEQIYEVQPIYQRGSHGRTWVAIGTVVEISDATMEDEPTSNSKSPDSAAMVIATSPSCRVVKDLWMGSGRRFEGLVLEYIQKHGYIPGVVRYDAGGSLDMTTGGIGAKGLTKYRLVMGSSGLRLSACKSVLEFLKIIYDTIEAHESVLEQGVLHGDVSWLNVLCYPEHYIGEEDQVIDKPNIGKVLGDPKSQPLCLLTDFDCAALIANIKPEKEDITGTAMFMACELTYGKTAYQYLKHEDLNVDFALEGDVLEKYISVYGQERYKAFNTFLTTVALGGLAEVDPYSAKNDTFTFNQAHHDLESIFWIILWFLAKAWPDGQNLSLNENRRFNERIAIVMQSRNHEHNMDIIVQILTYTELEWKAMLNPAFRSLAKMLSDMAEYLCVCWSRFPSVGCNWWHCHEAFKRLLLKEIVRLTNENNPITIRGPRPTFASTSSTKPDKLASALCLNKLDSMRTLRPSAQTPSHNYKPTASQPFGNVKQTRPRAMSFDSKKAAKKPRLSYAYATTTRPVIPPKLSLAQRCLANIEDDEKWFLL